MMHPVRMIQRTRITTASPGELLVLLMEGLVRAVAAAADAMEESRWQECGKQLSTALEIIGHFQDTLHGEVAPKLAAALERTYLAWSRGIVRAQIARDPGLVRALLPSMMELLDTWRIAVQETGGQR